MMTALGKARALTLVVALVFVPALAWAQAPGTGLAGTGHDFSGITAAGQASGLCTFCHTPHKAQSQALLWNRTLSATAFSWTDPKTTAGTDYPTFVANTYKGPSSKCLSCHDGSVAVGDVAWWNAQGPVSFPVGPISNPTYLIGGGGNMTGNHPVAMPFPFNNVGSTYNGSTTGPAMILADWKADPQASGIRLYTDDGAGNITAGATPGQTGIECTSCHDAHNSSAVQDVFFLRGLLGGNTPDYICVKCHTK